MQNIVTWGQNMSANIEEFACISMGGLFSGVPPGLLLLCKAREHTAGRTPLNKLSIGKKCKHCVLQLQFCNPRDNILEGFFDKNCLDKNKAWFGGVEWYFLRYGPIAQTEIL